MLANCKWSYNHLLVFFQTCFGKHLKCLYKLNYCVIVQTTYKLLSCFFALSQIIFIVVSIIAVCVCGTFCFWFLVSLVFFLLLLLFYSKEKSYFFTLHSYFSVPFPLTLAFTYLLFSFNFVSVFCYLVFCVWLVSNF